MERNLLKKLGIKILIISRGRSETIGEDTARILPDYIEVLVPNNEKGEYEIKIKNPILTIPEEIKGLGEVRNFVLENFQEETVIMLDDDIRYMYYIAEEKTKRINDKEKIIQILINTAVMAKDLGTNVFGFSQTDIRKFNATQPFILNTWVGCCIGVIGRKFEFRKDKFKVDIDYCLQNLLENRVTFVDNRYYFLQNRDNNIGGNSGFRTQNGFEGSVNSLKDKWGSNLVVKKHKNQIKINLNVKRKQQIKI